MSCLSGKTAPCHNSGKIAVRNVLFVKWPCLPRHTLHLGLMNSVSLGKVPSSIISSRRLLGLFSSMPRNTVFPSEGPLNKPICAPFPGGGRLAIFCIPRLLLFVFFSRDQQEHVFDDAIQFRHCVHTGVETSSYYCHRYGTKDSRSLFFTQTSIKTLMVTSTTS